MSVSSSDGEHFSRHMLIRCSEHGLVGAGPAGDRAVLMEKVGLHFAHEHGAGVAVEGREYTIEPAGVRCDVCNDVAEPPWWQHLTDVPVHTEAVIDNDQRWLLCQTCHGYAVEPSGRYGAWVNYVAGRAMAGTASLDEGQVRVYLAGHLGKLIAHMDSGHRLTSLADD